MMRELVVGGLLVGGMIAGFVWFAPSEYDPGVSFTPQTLATAERANLGLEDILSDAQTASVPELKGGFDSIRHDLAFCRGITIPMCEDRRETAMNLTIEVARRAGGVDALTEITAQCDGDHECVWNEVSEPAETLPGNAP